MNVSAGIEVLSAVRVTVWWRAESQ